jgi:hypothetical protein
MAMCPLGHRYVPAPSARSRCPICPRERNAERYRSDPDRRLLSHAAGNRYANSQPNGTRTRCRFEGPDCYGRLEAHHFVAVKFGGPAYDLDNIALMCKRHHFLLERETRMRAQGTLRE